MTSFLASRDFVAKLSENHFEELFVALLIPSTDSEFDDCAAGAASVCLQAMADQKLLRGVIHTRRQRLEEILRTKYVLYM